MKVVKSGDVVIGRCGIPAGIDTFGDDLFVGDIVQYWNVDEHSKETCWSSVSLSVMAECDSSCGLGVKPFAFGIESVKYLQPCDIDCDHEDFTGDPESYISGWVVKKVKDHSQCINGESWSDFKFSYDELNDHEATNLSVK
jgi:hypothetical protein